MQCTAKNTDHYVHALRQSPLKFQSSADHNGNLILVPKG